jgi:hypothetical protein
MYKLGFLTLVLSVVSAQVVCEDNGLDKCVVPVVPVVPVSTTTVVCDDNGVDGTCTSTSTSTLTSTSTSTSTSTLTSTSDAKTGLNSSSGKKNSVMYIFGLLPLLFL